MTPSTHSTGPESTDVAVIGGGAAGFFCAITIAELSPHKQVRVFESGRQYLSKVRISGGGRCNVTHHCFDPRWLAEFYPRGGRELRGAFHRWQPQDMINWFEANRVQLIVEEDGRMFPSTHNSQTIIDCFLRLAQSGRVQLSPRTALKALTPSPAGGFELDFGDAGKVLAGVVCLASGSLKASTLTQALTRLGHRIEPLAPSLFAVNVSDKRIQGLLGVAVPQAVVRLQEGGSGPRKGPLLITHRGFSGPAILRLSAWEARLFQERNYHTEININWAGGLDPKQGREALSRLRKASGNALVRNRAVADLPHRLWERLVQAAGIDRETTWAHLPKKQEAALFEQVFESLYTITGKTTNKDEFVTCGGVSLKEVDFRTMESRIVPGLYFAGECLDIDGVTGGFNFQAAWTTARIAGTAIAVTGA
jgi:predicted Rossmann fold flavoprotein